MKEHPDKHIRAAIEYALARGWLLSPYHRLPLEYASHFNYLVDSP